MMESRVALYECDSVITCYHNDNNLNGPRVRCDHTKPHFRKLDCNTIGCLLNSQCRCVISTIINVNDESVLSLPEAYPWKK